MSIAISFVIGLLIGIGLTAYYYTYVIDGGDNHDE